MIDYEDLCLSVKEIGEMLGFDYEVEPMRSYTVRDISTDDYVIKAIKIIFSSDRTKYTYFLPTYDWNRFQENQKDFDAFIEYLTARVRENIIV